MVAVFFSGLRDRSPVLVSFCANKGTDARGGPRASLTAGAKRVVFRLQWENVFFPEPCEGCFDCCTSGQEKPWPTFFERRQNLGPHRGSSADRAGGPGVGNRPRSGRHHRHHPRAGPRSWMMPVMAPGPGPISNTRSSGPIRRRSTMRAEVLASFKKCWPRLFLARGAAVKTSLTRFREKDVFPLKPKYYPFRTGCQ